MGSQNETARDQPQGSRKNQEDSRHRDRQPGTEDDRATRMDGNPNPRPADSDVLKPRDDTPFILEKREEKRR